MPGPSWPSTPLLPLQGTKWHSILEVLPQHLFMSQLFLSLFPVLHGTIHTPITGVTDCLNYYNVS